MKGCRALVVEDSSLLIGLLEEVLAGLDIEVVGPVGSLSDALQLATDEVFQFAMLDINLHGEKVFPVADVLTERGIPFFFTSGYVARNVLPPRYAGAEVLAKPYNLVRLTALINSMVEQSRSAGSS